jgi:hypothetical protein
VPEQLAEREGAWARGPSQVAGLQRLQHPGRAAAGIAPVGEEGGIGEGVFDPCSCPCPCPYSYSCSGQTARDRARGPWSWPRSASPPPHQPLFRRIP